MFKFSRYTKIFIFMLSALLSYANIGAANTASAQTDCAGGFFGYGTTATGEFIALPGPGDALGVTSMPEIFFDGLSAVALTITNQMPNGLSLHNGYFSVEFRYTPEGGNPDGSDDVFVQSTADVEVSGLSSGQTMNAAFNPELFIPVDRWDSIRCTLIYFGAIGSASHIILLKDFLPGEMLLYESWKNGLTGTNDWVEEKNEHGPGSSSNSVDNSELTMLTTRSAGAGGSWRINTLVYRFTSENNPEGILVTDNTRIQFIIDQMETINPDNTPVEHSMYLEFSDGTNPYHLLFCKGGNYKDMGSIAVVSDFNEDLLSGGNIRQTFENAGVLLPSIYLQEIVFLQGVGSETDPETQINFNMVVDELIIVDESTR